MPVYTYNNNFHIKYDKIQEAFKGQSIECVDGKFRSLTGE